MTLPKMTHRQHLELAERVRFIRDELMAIHIELSEAFGKTASVTTSARSASKRFNVLRCDLDTEYHYVTTQAQYLAAGHVYYGAGEKTVADAPL